MLAFLKGKVEFKSSNFVAIDVNGVGYLVYASSKTLSKLIKGSEAVLFIETVVREDSIASANSVLLFEEICLLFR